MFYEYDSKFLPEIHLADRARIEPPYIHRRRVPGEYIIYVILSGEMHLYEERTLYHLKPGDFLILDPDREHVGERASYCEYYYIHFQCASMQRMDETEDGGFQRMLKMRNRSLQSDSSGSWERIGTKILIPKVYHLAGASDYSELTQKMNEGIALHKNHLEGYKTLCACRILEVLIRVSRQYLSGSVQKHDIKGAGEYQKIYDVLDYLNTCYREHITGDSLEKRIGYNFDYLNRVFKKMVGKTIFQYLSEVRIAHARELALTTSMNQAQIGDQVGFTDVSYFGKVFKKQTGMTPGEFRRERQDLSGIVKK